MEPENWKKKYEDLNRQLMCELRDPNGTIWEHAKFLQDENARHVAEIEELRARIAVLQGLGLITQTFVTHDVPTEISSSEKAPAEEILFALELCRLHLEHRGERKSKDAEAALIRAQQVALRVLDEHRETSPEYWARFRKFAATI